MMFVLQRRKIASRIVGHSRDNCTSKECIPLAPLPYELQGEASWSLHLLLWSLFGSFYCGSYISQGILKLEGHIISQGILKLEGQKEGKYNIVKAFTTEESTYIPMAITVAEMNKKIPDLHAIVLQSANKNELFSPSIKKLLDTIAETSATANKVPPPVTTAKRALIFGTVPPEIGSNSAEAITPASLPTNALSAFAPTNLAPGSPLKKQRDNEL